MIDGTLKGIFEGEETITRTLDPCDMVFVVGIRNEDDSHTACQQVIMGGKELKTVETVDALADSAVEFLIKLSGDSRRMQAMILTAYMKGFIGYAADKNGTAVMDEVKKFFAEMK